VRIEAHTLTKRFGRVTALDGVSFGFAPRSRVALVGPNGSGKTTLNRILMGLVAFEGSARIDGLCPFRDRGVLAPRIAYVPQIAPQLAAPVGEVVAAIARVRALEPRAIAHAARELGLDVAAIARLPFRSLSGGTRQKLSIALALASRASCLILDEPTGSLDAHARERFFAVVEALAPGATLLLCSHRLDEIRALVDHVLLLEDGRVAYDGAAGAFLERCALATIDVWSEGEDAAGWLLARGFHHTPSGVWRRTVSHAEKMKLLPEISRELGAGLRNLSARDLDGIHPGGAPPDLERVRHG
jgi:ABC-2 type transport system ATP-binding protein